MQNEYSTSHKTAPTGKFFRDCSFHFHKLLPDGCKDSSFMFSFWIHCSISAVHFKQSRKSHLKILIPVIFLDCNSSILLLSQTFQRYPLHSIEMNDASQQEEVLFPTLDGKKLGSVLPNLLHTSTKSKIKQSFFKTIN